MAGPYYSYGGNLAFFNSEYNYYQLDPSFDQVDGYYVRGYGYPAAVPARANFSLPQSTLPPQRTPTPPPAEPTPEYIATSLSPQPPSVPQSQRKLLIFDLNGTLLLRSPRNFGARKIYLRPYVRALVAYISHPTVRAWLDCMVWSSAQTHNVREMVDRVFGAGEGAGTGPILRAVWARDTLGLSREAFHRKTQTTKDLAKPWAFFASPRLSSTSRVSSPSLGQVDAPQSKVADNGGWYPPTETDGHRPETWPSGSPPRTSSPPIVRRPSPTAKWPVDSASQPLAMSADSNTDSEPPPYPHGAESTLLVDDSPLKARLQPWNHLCVHEYDASTHASDLAAGLLPDADPSNVAPPQVPAVNDALAENSAAPTIDVQVSKDRWRKRRKEDDANSTESSPALTEDVTGSASGVSASTSVIPDGEPSAKVPAGMSKRALRRERKRLRKAGMLDNGASDRAPEQPSSTDVSPSLSPPATIAAEVSESPSRAEVLSNEDTETGSGNETHVVPGISLASPALPDDGSRKRKRHVDEEDGLECKQEGIEDKATEGDEPYDPTLLAVVGVLAHVRSIGNIAAWMRSGGLKTAEQDHVADEVLTQMDGSTTDEETVPNADFTSWFTSRRLLKAWAARGRAALSELGIDAAPGVD